MNRFKKLAQFLDLPSSQENSNATKQVVMSDERDFHRPLETFRANSYPSDVNYADDGDEFIKSVQQVMANNPISPPYPGPIDGKKSRKLLDVLLNFQWTLSKKIGEKIEIVSGENINPAEFQKAMNKLDKLFKHPEKSQERYAENVKQFQQFLSQELPVIGSLYHGPTDGNFNKELELALQQAEAIIATSINSQKVFGMLVSNGKINTSTDDLKQALELIDKSRKVDLDKISRKIKLQELVKKAGTRWFNVAIYHINVIGREKGTWALSVPILSDPSGKDTAGIVPINFSGDWKSAVNLIINETVGSTQKSKCSGELSELNGIKPNDLLSKCSSAVTVNDDTAQAYLSGPGYFTICGDPLIRSIDFIILFQESFGHEINRNPAEEEKELKKANRDDLREMLLEKGDKIVDLQANNYRLSWIRHPKTDVYDVWFEDNYRRTEFSPYGKSEFKSMPHVGFFSGRADATMNIEKLIDIIEWFEDTYNVII